MARQIDRLTDLTLRRAKKPGWYADGLGLYLRIDETGAKRWVFVFQWQKRRAEMGLGALRDVGLADARALRNDARKLVKEGLNPIDARRAEREAAALPAVAEVTFSAWAAEVAPEIGPNAEKAAKAWLKTMQVNVGRLAEMEPASIATEHVLAALKPYWQTRPVLAQRMRQRIERVLDAARARGHIPADQWSNPARWRGHLENLLRRPTAAVQHHKALPYAEMPAFMADLRTRDSMAALALQWTILTVARTGETIFAEAAEISRAEKLWIVPAARMKGEAGKKREHRVPLTQAALDVLDRAAEAEQPAGATWLFPSTFRPGKPLSTAAMERIMDDMGFKGVATVHGMRSAFRDWAGDCTNFAHETVEAALAHVQGDETSRAYRRSDALLKRQKLMEAWAGYLLRPAGSNVRTLSRPAG